MKYFRNIKFFLPEVIFLLIFCMAIWLCPEYCHASTVTLTWDENDPVPDGYRIFQRIDNEVYNYSNPVWEGTDTTCTFVNIGPSYPQILPVTDLIASYNRSSKSITISWKKSDSIMAVSTYYYVARAYEGSIESADSEEVHTELTAQNEPVEYKIYYSETSGTGFVEFATATNVTITEPFTVVKEGEKKDIYFTIVTFGIDGTYSVNSEEVMVTIDRRVIPPSGMRITVTIPVE